MLLRYMYVYEVAVSVVAKYCDYISSLCEETALRKSVVFPRDTVVSERGFVGNSA